MCCTPSRLQCPNFRVCRYQGSSGISPFSSLYCSFFCPFLSRLLFTNQAPMISIKGGTGTVFVLSLIPEDIHCTCYTLCNPVSELQPLLPLHPILVSKILVSKILVSKILVSKILVSKILVSKILVSFLPLSLFQVLTLPLLICFRTLYA